MKIEKKKTKSDKRKISTLAGAWKMSDKGAKGLFKSLRKGWNKKER